MGVQQQLQDDINRRNATNAGEEQKDASQRGDVRQGILRDKDGRVRSVDMGDPKVTPKDNTDQVEPAMSRMSNSRHQSMMTIITDKTKMD